MKSFKSILSEVAQPKSSEEKAFKDMHTYDVKPHPVAMPHQHTGDIQKADDAARIADQKGDAAYDQAYNPKGAQEPTLRVGRKFSQFRANESVLEENPAEEIPMMKSQLDFICTAATAISKALGNNDPEEWYQNKLATAHEAMKTLHANIIGKNEDVNESKDMANAKALDKASSSSAEGKKKVTLAKAPWDKTEELKGGQKKLDHNKNGKIDGHDFAVMRARKKNESVETLDEDKSEEAADQHEYETVEHRDHADDHAKAAKMHAAKAKSSKDSSVANKHKAASAAHDKAREHALDAAHHHQAAADAHRDKDSGAKKATKTADRHTSLHYAASEKADAHSSKLTEEVVAETTSSAIKRPVTTTGPDGKTRTVFKKAKVDRTDDRGQDVIVGEGIVNELSKKTLGSYIKKATGDVQKSSGKAGYASGKGVNKSEYDRQTDNAEKRTAGINKATNKLVGESFTEMLDEAVKIGNLRLKDGKSVKVSAQDAKLLNQFYKDLNAKNRRDMEKVMMKDTSGFEEIVGFAREAL